VPICRRADSGIEEEEISMGAGGSGYQKFSYPLLKGQKLLG
jgi:hypothetical protein